MIGGEGSDETFGGYSRYLILQKIHELYQMESLQGYIPMLDSIFGSFIKVHSKLCGISEEVLEKRYKEREGKGIINQIGWAEFNESLEPIHQMEISLAKHFDIDLRLPFYDADVQQYGWSLTDENKIQGERRKVKVLEIAEKRLPRLVWRRKDKKGFVCPANKWSGSESDYDKTKYMELQTKLCEVKKDELANVKKDKTKVA
jgi:asparagine synthetase B (glutamine-hydrolysing)